MFLWNVDTEMGLLRDKVYTHFTKACEMLFELATSVWISISCAQVSPSPQSSPTF